MTTISHRARPLDLTCRLQLSKKQRVQPLPDTGLLPLDHPPIAGRARTEAELERQMPPRDPGVEHEQDPLQRLPIGQPLPTGKTTRRSTLGNSGSIRSQCPSETTHGARLIGTPSSLTTDADGIRQPKAGPFISIRSLNAPHTHHRSPGEYLKQERWVSSALGTLRVSSGRAPRAPWLWPAHREG